MRLTTHTDYGLRLLMLLAIEPDRLHTVEEVADRYGISRHHVAKIAKGLVQSGFIAGVRGRNGGLRLTRSAAAISLGDAIRALEGRPALVECFETGNTCRITSACRLQRLLHEAMTAFMAVVDRCTLADAISDGSRQDRMRALLANIPIVAMPVESPRRRPRPV